MIRHDTTDCVVMAAVLEDGFSDQLEGALCRQGLEDCLARFYGQYTGKKWRTVIMWEGFLGFMMEYAVYVVFSLGK